MPWTLWTAECMMAVIFEFRWRNTAVRRTIDGVVVGVRAAGPVIAAVDPALDLPVVDLGPGRAADAAQDVGIPDPGPRSNPQKGRNQDPCPSPDRNQDPCLNLNLGQDLNQS